MQMTKINSSKDLWNIYSKDEKTHLTDFTKDGDSTTLFKAYACTKPLIILRDNKIITTHEWFITQIENELIYDIENNDWVNLTMFDNGESYCKEIYYVTQQNV